MTTENRNVMKQLELQQKLQDNNPFSPKGLKYLAKRSLGTTYNKILDVALTAMTKGELQELIPTELKEQIKVAFNYTELPDAALVIIGTGRRAVHGKNGWDEGGDSLLTLPVVPLDYEELDKKAQQRLTKMVEIRTMQKVLSEKLMEILLSHVPKPVVVTPPPAPPVKEKTGEVLPFKKKSKAKPAKEEPAPPVEPTPPKTPLKRKAAVKSQTVTDK